MIDFDFYTPQTTHELTSMLGKTGSRILAGGTDVIPRLRRGQFPTTSLVDISRMKELHFIRDVDGQIQIGALTTHADLAASPLIQETAPALSQAVATIGCPSTRNRGTLGGNLANASPAADSVPPLLALDAQVNLGSAGGKQRVRLRDFFLGPGKTILTQGEYIESIAFHRPQGKWGTTFYKLGKRSGMAISIASAAAYLELGQDGCLQAARLAFGSVAPCPIRGSHAEEILLGKAPSMELFQQAGQAALADISPIGDIRASIQYRMHVVPILVQRVLMAALQQAEKRPA